MKPTGIKFGVNRQGPALVVTHPSGAEDAIWEAVQKAINHEYTPQQFIREAAAAWEEEMDAAKKDAMQSFRQGF